MRVRLEAHPDRVQHTYITFIKKIILVTNAIKLSSRDRLSYLLNGPHDIQHNNVQHNDIQPNDIPQNDIQPNDIQHNDIQHNDIQHNDIQHIDIQHIDIQHIDIKHNDTRQNDIYLKNKSNVALNMMTQSILMAVV